MDEIFSDTPTDGQLSPQQFQIVAEEAPVAVPPRPLDAIHRELEDAIARHSAALVDLKKAQQATSVLAAEYKAALTWFEEEGRKLEASVDDLAHSVGGWLESTLKKVF